MPQPPLSQMERRRLINQGMNAAIDKRLEANIGLSRPLCIYELCAREGIRVRFLKVSMEGIYQRGSPPRIHLSSLRPGPRQVFSCGHELGHHVFGHGSTLDPLNDDGRSDEDRDKPEEVLVNAFSAFLLMPTLGVREALAIRGLSAHSAQPLDLYRVSSSLCVGYATLVNHLAYGLDMMSATRARELSKANPKSIRTSLSPYFANCPLLIADSQWRAPHLDLEVDSHVLLPAGVQVDEKFLAPCDIAIGEELAFRALRPGTSTAATKNGTWVTTVRIAPKEFEGLAEYRHFEDSDDDKED